MNSRLAPWREAGEVLGVALRALLWLGVAVALDAATLRDAAATEHPTGGIHTPTAPAAIVTDTRDRDPRPPLPLGLRQPTCLRLVAEATPSARAPLAAHRHGWPAPPTRPRLLGGANDEDDHQHR